MEYVPRTWLILPMLSETGHQHPNSFRRVYKEGQAALKVSSQVGIGLSYSRHLEAYSEQLVPSLSLSLDLSESLPPRASLPPLYIFLLTPLFPSASVPLHLESSLSLSIVPSFSVLQTSVVETLEYTDQFAGTTHQTVPVLAPFPGPRHLSEEDSESSLTRKTSKLSVPTSKPGNATPSRAPRPHTRLSS
ncbi:hypothetical protein LZ30DRAFT_80324 [Colletotrichum cereale]|nr:hypothetical protein LZ30DRAFT_80324 [Colletotrichum cereale]